MSTMPPPSLAQALKQVALVEQNKRAAREQLLRIQLLLARKAH